MNRLDFIKNLFPSFKNFVYGKEYPLFLGIIAITLHFLELQFIGLSIFVIVACLILLFIDDLTPILPLAFLVIFNFHDYGKTTSPIFYLILSPALICFIFHPFKYKKEEFKLGKFFAPQVCICLSLALGGVCSLFMHHYILGLIEVIAFGPLVLFVYVYFVNYLNPPKDFNLKKNLCYLIVVMALVGGIEEILMLLLKVAPDALDKDLLGWGSMNVVATLTVLALPCAFYLLTISKNIFLYLFIVIFFIISIALSGSEACLGISIVITLISILYSICYINKNRRHVYLMLLLSLLSLCLVLLGILSTSGLLDTFIDRVSQAISSDSGRTVLYREAYHLFLTNPIFGVGMGYSNFSNLWHGESPLIYYNFHSTFFNTLAKMGAVGVLSYTFQYVLRYRELMKYHKPFHVFLTLGFGAYATYAMIDTAEFNIMPCVIVITLIFTVLEIINEREQDALPLN